MKIKYPNFMIISLGLVMAEMIALLLFAYYSLMPENENEIHYNRSYWSRNNWITLSDLYHYSKDEKGKGDEVKLRSDIKSGYTVDEMIKEVKKETRRNQYEESKPDSSNDEDLQRIQDLIRQNEASFQEPIMQNTESLEQATQPRKGKL